MRRWITAGAFLVLCLWLGTVASAQEGHPLKGSWSGDWGANAQRTPLLIVMNFENGKITGTVNPGTDNLVIEMRLSILMVGFFISTQRRRTRRDRSSSWSWTVRSKISLCTIDPLRAPGVTKPIKATLRSLAARGIDRVFSKTTCQVRNRHRHDCCCQAGLFAPFGAGEIR